MVELGPFKTQVAGSSPARRTKPVRVSARLGSGVNRLAGKGSHEACIGPDRPMLVELFLHRCL